MFKLIHLSDLHFGRTLPEMVHAVAIEVRQQNPDLVVISGDFTTHGRKREFRQARDFIRRLERPVFAVPGNHDMPYYNPVARFALTHQRYRRYIAPDLAPVRHIGPVFLVGVNTARSAGLYMNWALGQMSRSQVDETVARLGEAPTGCLRVVVTHHPLIETDGQRSMRWGVGSRQAADRLSEAGADLLLSGHLHVGATSLQKVADGRHFIMAQASTATSVRLRGHDNAYNLIEVGDHSVLVSERRWRGGVFETGAQLSAHRHGATWRLAA